MGSFSSRRLLGNAACNTGAFLAYLVVSFMLTPIIVKALGDERYGAWSFVESFVAYLTLFDLGVAAALVRFVPRFVIRTDEVQLNRVYSASLTFFAIGAVLALALGAAFEWLFLNRFLPSTTYAGEIRWIFRLLVINFAMSLPLSVYPAILDGLGQFLLKSVIRVIMLTIRAALIINVLTYEQRLLALGLVITSCQLVENLWLAVAAKRIVPSLRFEPRNVTRQTVREVASYSGAAFVAMMSGRLAFHTDAFVIGPTLGTALITIFALPFRLFDMARSALRSATTTLTGVFSSLEASGDHQRLRKTFLAGSQAAWIVALPVQCGLLLLGKPFLQLWVGGHYAEECSPILWALAPLLSLTIAQSVASRVLYGTGQLRQFAWATVIEGVGNLAFSLILVWPMGVLGVAVGTAIPHGIMCIWVIGHVCRLQSVQLSDYLARIVMPLVAAILPIVIWRTADVNNWRGFIQVGTAGVLPYAIALTGMWISMRWFRARRGIRQVSPFPMRLAG